MAKKAAKKAPIKPPMKTVKKADAQKAVPKKAALQTAAAKKAALQTAAPKKVVASKANVKKEPVKSKISAPQKEATKKAATKVQNTAKPKEILAESPAKKNVETKSSLKEKPTPKLMTAEGKAQPPKSVSLAKVSASKPAKVPGASALDESLSKEDVNPQWYEFYRKYHQSPAQAYDMKEQFLPEAPLMHKVLGWGWIVSNDNDRLEVIFKDGKRMLISNYKST